MAVLAEYKGKRFFGLLLVIVTLLLAYFTGPSETFMSFANVIGAVYGVYATGQSWSDVRETQARET